MDPVEADSVTLAKIGALIVAIGIVPVVFLPCPGTRRFPSDNFDADH
jgi:hypothetical protein